MREEGNEEFVMRFIHSRFFVPIKLGLMSLILVFGVLPSALSPRLSALAYAADIPPTASTSPEASLLTNPDISAIEEGKALYENGQLIAALGKFMTVLRNDPHNSEARQYLRMIVDTMRQNPSVTSSKLGTKGQAVTDNPAVQEEIRQMLQRRSRLTMDLNAIPGVKVVIQKNVNQVWINTPILFGDDSGGLKEQGVPILDRAAAWLKTYGQQPIIIHCYPEELQDANSNGSLFLHRYSELYNFFVDERKLAAQRFVSADLLMDKKGETKFQDVAPSTTTMRIVIETIGAQSPVLEDMPSLSPGQTSSQWLENSITPSRRVFNPEEGEWTDLDLAALSRNGLRDWSFTLTPADGKSTQPVYQLKGKGNLLKRQSWDGHDQKTGDFVPAGNYTARLVSTNTDGTIKTQEEIVKVERTTKEEVPAMVEKPKAKPHAKAKAPKVTPTAASPAGFTAAPVVASQNGSASVSTSATTSAASSEESVHAIWKQVIQFDTNQSDLKPTVKSSLERIGKTLEVYPLQKVRITGFAMTSEANASTLATRRAEKVRSILVDEYHVDAKRVIVAGGKTLSEDNASKVEMSITN
jgi:outer membrane protein OmpA-like peptidoglycan-associated protein